MAWPFYPTTTPHVQCSETTKKGNQCARIVPAVTGMCDWHHPDAKDATRRSMTLAINQSQDWGRPPTYRERGPDDPSPRVPDSYIPPKAPDVRGSCSKCASSSLYTDATDIVCRSCGARWFSGQAQVVDTKVME